MKLIGDTISRPMATKHNGDTDNRPKAMKLSGDTINRPKATKRNGDTDNLRNDAKYAVRPKQSCRPFLTSRRRRKNWLRQDRVADETGERSPCSANDIGNGSPPQASTVSAASWFPTDAGKTLPPPWTGGVGRVVCKRGLEFCRTKKANP